MARTGNNTRVPALGTYGGRHTFAADLTEIASDAAGIIGESVATVNALPLSGNWQGRMAFVVEHKSLYVFTASQWRRIGVSGVQFVGSTDSNGILTVPLKFGSAPVWAQFTLQNGGQATDELARILSPMIWETVIGASTIAIRFRRNDTNQWVGAQPVVGFLTVGN